MTFPWFALRTRARAEKTVYDQLVRKQVEAFLPTVLKWSRWKDRKKQVEWPLFPGYCFAQFEPATSLRVLTCVGVASIVSFGSELAPIPEPEIESLRILVTSTLKFDPAPFLKEGELVRVVHGPLKGVTGRLVRKGEKARLFLSVEMIGQAVSAEVDASDVVSF
ncbi:MAG: UpxY family transcription antiterminator [Vicinamibacterales bacterium]